MIKLLATLAVLALAPIVAIGPAAAQVPPIQPPPGGSGGGGMAPDASNSSLPAAATNLGKWTTQIHQNTQTGECYGTGSGRVLCASDQNMDLIADHMAVQTQDASEIQYFAIGGSKTAGNVVGLNWTLASVVYQIRYTVQSGDTLATIAANLATCINAGGATNCTVTAGFLNALLAFHDANGFGYQPRAGTTATSTLLFDAPWGSANSVVAFLSGGATETMTQTGGKLDNGPYVGTARLVPGRTPVVGDAISNFQLAGQSAANSGLDTQYANILTRVLAQDPSNPQGELILGAADSVSAKNATGKVYVGNGTVFGDNAGTNCGYLGLGYVRVCYALNVYSTLSQMLTLQGIGSADVEVYRDTGGTGTNNYDAYYYRGSPKVQFGEFGSNSFGVQDFSGGTGNGGRPFVYTPSTALTQLGNGGQLSLTFGGGAQVGSPTGGDKGAGKLNATGLCVNGDCAVPLTDTAQSWTAPQRTNTETPAISTTTFTPVFSTGQNHRIVFPSTTCTCTIANPAAIVAGQSGVFELVQGATSASLNPTWGSEYVYPGGTSTILLTATLSGVDYIPYNVDSTGTFIVLGTPMTNPVH